MNDKVEIALNGVEKSVSRRVLLQWLDLGWREIQVEIPTKKTVKPKPAVNEEVGTEDIKGE
jgi:hypothetical protein